jgi:hypothetical protein
LPFSGLLFLRHEELYRCHFGCYGQRSETQKRNMMNANGEYTERRR